MAASVSLTAIYEPVENGWVQARLREIPAVITCAPTREEAEELLLDAMREYLLSLIEDGSLVESPSVSHGSVDITLEASEGAGR
jgi:predicted RNase H-like HicB family nuclease